jgi:hypothetical protein
MLFECPLILHDSLLVSPPLISPVSGLRPEAMFPGVHANLTARTRRP